MTVEQTETPDAADWWRSAVVYQIYPRSFQDSNGDGVGDLDGIASRLDHLQTLGVDVVWLSPIYRSPQADNGYDISDYQDIDPLFGTLDDFDRLLAAVHERGMKLVMDLVVNHSSDEHAWFQESRSSRESPKRDWYVWRDAAEDGGPPNNWVSFFSGPAWTFDEPTGQYYLRLFDPKQPDLNWENEEVRHAVHAMMRWWLDRGVDGFRMDVINLISKQPGLPDAPEHDRFAPFTNGPRIHEFLAEMHREVFAGREGAFLTVGETPGVTREEARLYTDPARAEVDMVFQFEHVGLDHGTSKFDVRDIDLVALKRNMHDWQRALADVGWNSLYWDNHDQPRAVSRFGDDSPEHWASSAKTLATVLHLQRGTPYVYQGEELGMTNAPFASFADVADVEARNHYLEVEAAGGDTEAALAGIRRIGRDNARTPVQWDAGAHAGFTAGEPWLPVNPNASWLNAAAQVDDPASVFAHHRALIALRHDLPVVAHGGFEALLEDDPALWVYIRDHDGIRLLVAANFGRAPRRVEVGAEWDGAVLLLGTVPGAPESIRGGGFDLAPWESRVHLLER